MKMETLPETTKNTGNMKDILQLKESFQGQNIQYQVSNILPQVAGEQQDFSVQF
ncbi:MAG TPA: hypothetical protein VHO92_01650 [Methanobacterium sp.]|nr:hypothetical protein [Methanobacterium sp.]